MTDARIRLRLLPADALEQAYAWSAQMTESVAVAVRLGSTAAAIATAAEVMTAELYQALCDVHRRTVSPQLVTFHASNPAAEGPFMPG